MSFLSCQSSHVKMETQSEDPTLNLDPAKFQKTINGKQTNLYFLQNKNGLKVAITNYGARIVAIFTPDRKGHLEDIVLGYNSLSDYLEKPNYYFGAIIGRYANRIAGGTFTLNGKNIQFQRMMDLIVCMEARRALTRGYGMLNS